MTVNIKKNKDQRNDAIANELKFDIIFIISSETQNPISVVTVSL